MPRPRRGEVCFQKAAVAAAQGIPNPEVVVKRPRGRPRKNPLQAAGSGQQAAPGPRPPAPSTLNPAPAVPFKRPRGRPRKNPIPVAAPEILAPRIPETDIPAGKGPGVAGHVEKGDPGIIAFKRPRGRPRKNPLPEAAGSKVAWQQGTTEGQQAAEIGQQGSMAARQQGTTTTAPGTLHPAPAARPRRSRRSAGRIPPFTIAPQGMSPFCPECGTYIRLFKPKRGRTRRVCPRCHPERMIEKRDPRFVLDKTGMPCKDRGKCRPERCVKALECTEMARKGSIRGSSKKSAG